MTAAEKEIVKTVEPDNSQQRKAVQNSHATSAHNIKAENPVVAQIVQPQNAEKAKKMAPN